MAHLWWRKPTVGYHLSIRDHLRYYLALGFLYTLLCTISFYLGGAVLKWKPIKQWDRDPNSPVLLILLICLDVCYFYYDDLWTTDFCYIWQIVVALQCRDSRNFRDSVKAYGVPLSTYYTLFAFSFGHPSWNQGSSIWPLVFVLGYLLWTSWLWRW